MCHYIESCRSYTRSRGGIATETLSSPQSYMYPTNRNLLSIAVNVASADVAPLCGWRSWLYFQRRLMRTSTFPFNQPTNQPTNRQHYRRCWCMATCGSSRFIGKSHSISNRTNKSLRVAAVQGVCSPTMCMWSNIPTMIYWANILRLSLKAVLLFEC